MHGIDDIQVPRSFADLSILATTGTDAARRAADDYLRVAARTREAMRELLTRHLPAGEADAMAEGIAKHLDRVSAAMAQLQAEFHGLGTAADFHHKRALRLTGDAQGSFRI